ncbi:MAG: hypothetical protein K9M54_10510 [Kiritimatiellales bacterium]|nr:hypothetical protein [Kiritimatiellales bacterium]
MKKVIVGLVCIIAVCSVYSGIPSEPKPREEKLAVQVVKVEHPKKIDLTSGYGLDPEAMFEDGSNTLTQYPTLYAAVGTTVTNDQTTSVAFPEDFDIIDGKAIPKEKIQKLGLSIVAELSRVENDVVDMKLSFSKKELKGYDEIAVKGGIQVKIPYFNVRNINTDVSIVLGDWIVLGGAEEFDSKKEMTTCYLLRVKNPERGQ